jgi:hypothetical protein
MSLDFIGREMHALKRAPISAVLILLAALVGGFTASRMIYLDQVAFWERAYQYERAATRTVVPGLTDKALKQYVLAFAEGARPFSDEHQVRLFVRIFARASETLTNAPDDYVVRCEAFRADAMRLRNEVLGRLPAVYRSDVAGCRILPGRVLGSCLLP